MTTYTTAEENISAFFWDFAVYVPLQYYTPEQLQIHMQVLGEIVEKELSQEVLPPQALPSQVLPPPAFSFNSHRPPSAVVPTPPSPPSLSCHSLHPIDFTGEEDQPPTLELNFQQQTHPHENSLNQVLINEVTNNLVTQVRQFYDSRLMQLNIREHLDLEMEED